MQFEYVKQKNGGMHRVAEHAASIFQDKSSLAPFGFRAPLARFSRLVARWGPGLSNKRFRSWLAALARS